MYVADKASRELGPLEEETAGSKYVCLMSYQSTTELSFFGADSNKLCLSSPDFL